MNVDETNFIYFILAKPYGFILAGIWGALWGSFFNVLIVRLPQSESVVRPASHCRNCKAPIHWYDNIPILSYLILRGRCRCCGERFSARYVLVETLVALLSIAMYSQYFLSNSGELGLRVAQFVITSLFCGLLVAVAFIDLDTMHIPDSITYPGIPIAMILSVFMGHPHFFDGLIGGVAGYLIIRLIADGYRLLTGRMGMGYGDAKLLALIGGILGWQALFPTLFLASFQGTIIGISAILWFRKKNSKEPARTPPTSNYSVASSEDETKNSCADKQGEEQEEQNVPPSSLRYTRIPFGPFLSLGAIEVLFLRDILPCFFPYLQ